MSDLRKPDVVTVAVTRVDGGVTVLRVIVTEYRPSTPEEQEAGADRRVPVWTKEATPERIAAVIAKHNWQGPLAPVSWRVVPNDYVNEATDRTFRAAWKDGPTTPDVDMPKAREVHRTRLRRMRAPLLEALDVEYVRADEAKSAAKKKAIAARKQALRDVTADPAIDAAQTPDELKAILPEPLRG